MNILILVFSPAGSTLKISGLLEQELIEKGHAVQLLDITRNAEIFARNNQRSYLDRVVRPHDLICIGSPVYEKHVEYYVRRLIEQLPGPDSTWGRYAVPFFTYGGISSGIALGQAVDLLEKGGRQSIACMKVEASHIKTKKLKNRVNENLPGDEALPLIADLADRIDRFDETRKFIDRKELNYQNLRERLLCVILNERLLHRHKYGKLTIMAQQCNTCGKCVQVCPIQRIKLEGNRPVMDGTLPECIHCFSCVNACPQEAITYDNGDEGWATIERIFSKVAREGSPFRSTEFPKSAVYPLKK